MRGLTEFIDSSNILSWFFRLFHDKILEFTIFHAIPQILLVSVNLKIWTILRESDIRRRQLFQVPSLTIVRNIKLTNLTFIIVGLSLISNILLVAHKYFSVFNGTYGNIFSGFMANIWRRFVFL